jgi:hypothetical protein
MLWHADMLSSAAVLSLTETHRAMRWVFPTAGKDTGATPIAIRAAELIAFDLPVSIFFVSLNHDLGHEVRATELNIGSSLRLVGSPWSVHPFVLETDGNYPYVWGPSLFDLGLESGGLEASWVLKDRLDERVLRRGRVGFGDAVTLLIASIDTPVYAAKWMDPGALNQVLFAPQGDIVNYAHELSDERARAGQLEPDIRGTVRGRCLLNLLDFSLWSDVATIGGWLRHGNESRPQSWLRIGSVGLIPSMRYSLTPIGPEFSVRSQFSGGHALGSAYVRWSERTGNARQKGAGVAYMTPVFRGLESTIRFDAWSHSVNGTGGRAEISVATLRWPGRDLHISGSVGAKSSGYLEGYPLTTSVYAAVGLNVVVR